MNCANKETMIQSKDNHAETQKGGYNMTPEVKKVVLPNVITTQQDMTFNGEPLAGVSSKKPGDITWTTIDVYRVFPHSNPRHPSNKHVGKFIVVIWEKSGIDATKNKITYIHCANPEEVVSALHQTWKDGQKVLTFLSQKCLKELALNEPGNFKK